MISSDVIKGAVRIHGAKSISAEPGPFDPVMQNEVAWLTIKISTGDEIVIFMPYETALAYASAINTVNNREAVDAENGISRTA